MDVLNTFFNRVSFSRFIGPSGDIIEAYLEKAGHYPVWIRFSPTDVSVYGDYGFYIFKGNIVKPLTFFCGDKTNPGYWSEKIESAPSYYYVRNIDEDRLKENLKVFLEDNGLSELVDDVDDLCADRDTPESWYDVVTDLVWSKDSTVSVSDVIDSSISPCHTYLLVCDILQAVSNYMLDNKIVDALKNTQTIMLNFKGGNV